MGDLVTAAQSGDQYNTLVALRNRLAEEIEQTTSGRDLAALSKQLKDVLDAIADLPTGRESSPADEIAKRREERRKKAIANVESN